MFRDNVNELDDDPDFSLISGGEDNYNPSKDSTESSSINRIDSLNRLSFIKPVLFRKRDWSRIGGFTNYQSVRF